MAIPDFQSIMLPLLTALTDGQLRSTQQLEDALAPVFKLTDDERIAPPSGTRRLSRSATWPDDARLRDDDAHHHSTRIPFVVLKSPPLEQKAGSGSRYQTW